MERVLMVGKWFSKTHLEKKMSCSKGLSEMFLLVHCSDSRKGCLPVFFFHASQRRGRRRVRPGARKGVGWTPRPHVLFFSRHPLSMSIHVH